MPGWGGVDKTQLNDGEHEDVEIERLGVVQVEIGAMSRIWGEYRVIDVRTEGCMCILSTYGGLIRSRTGGCGTCTWLS